MLVSDDPTTLVDFAHHYEDFTSLLCGAARYGCSASREAEYAELRAWILTHYEQFVHRVRPHLTNLFGPSAVTDGHDPVVQTFHPSHLRELLAADTGELISRVSLISEAVFQCCNEVGYA